MRVGDLIVSRKCIWYFGKSTPKRRMGIILSLRHEECGSILYNCWFEELGEVELYMDAIDPVEVSCLL